MLLTEELHGAGAMAAQIINLDDRRITHSRKRTTAEQQAAMLALRTAGMTFKAIAIELKLSDTTVNHHVGHVRRPVRTRPVTARTPEFDRAMMAERAYLMGAAMKLTRHPAHAEDLVQATLLRAMEAPGHFEVGTNMAAWLTTIMRNEFLNHIRRHGRTLREDPDGEIAERQPVAPTQESGLQMERLREALLQLTPEHRDVLTLVGMEDLSYDEAAARLGVPTGTIKSRVNRARAALARLLQYHPDDTATDGLMAAAQQSSSSVMRHE